MSTTEAVPERLQEAPWRRELRLRWLPRIAGYVVFLVVWSWASGRWIEDFLLPSPWTILQEMWAIVESGEFWIHFRSTIQKIAIGYTIAYVLGTAVGIIMARRWWDGFFRDWVVVTLNTPGLIFALLMALIFGFSPIGPIVAIIVTSFSFVTINVAEGVKALPKDLFDMATAFRTSELRRLRHVIIPFLAPYLFTALRYGFSIAWKITMLTELFGSSKGIGFMMRTSWLLFDIPAMLAWAFFFFAFALFLEKVLLQAGMKRFFRWRQEAVVT